MFYERVTRIFTQTCITGITLAPRRVVKFKIFFVLFEEQTFLTACNESLNFVHFLSLFL